jgi:hypothetical protein
MESGCHLIQLSQPLIKNQPQYPEKSSKRQAPHLTPTFVMSPNLFRRQPHKTLKKRQFGVFLVCACYPFAGSSSFSTGASQTTNF